MSTTGGTRQKRRATKLTDLRISPSVRRGDREPIPPEVILNAIAHDMRRHLTPIIGVSHTLLDHGSKLSEAERTEYVEITLRNAIQLEHLIHDIIDLQRFDSVGWILHRQPTDVRALIDGLIPSLDIGSRSLTVNGNGPVVNIDPGLLERIIDNLVQNAKAHTPADSPIVISTRSDDTGAHVIVQDSGPGVPDAIKTAIFEDYHSGQVGGTGLGLSLVKRFSEVHGGRAWVEDVAGGGARFCVHLPQAADAPRATGASAESGLSID